MEKFFLTGSKAGIQPKHAAILADQLTLLNIAKNPEMMNVPTWGWHALKGEFAEAPATMGGVAFAPAHETVAEKRAEARMKGYVGEACPECGNFTMVRNGTCLKCDTCGATTGCS